MTTDGKEDKDRAGTEENEDDCVVLNGIKGEEGLAAPPATTQTPTSMTSISSRHGDQTTTGKGGPPRRSKEEDTSSVRFVIGEKMKTTT